MGLKITSIGALILPSPKYANYQGCLGRKRKIHSLNLQKTTMMENCYLSCNIPLIYQAKLQVLGQSAQTTACPVVEQVHIVLEQMQAQELGALESRQ